MSTQITITNISGVPPFNVYLCDNPITLSIYIDTISTFPYNVTIPPIWSNLTSFNIKVIDDINCESILNITLGPQPTPTPTPTPTNPFIILVSVSGLNQFTVPTNPSYPYNYTVKTSEQTFNNVTGDILLTWSNPGDYTVEITEQFPAYLHDGSSELQEVQQWGDIVWSTFENAFTNSNVDVTATDVPNLTFVTNFNYAFSECYDLENLNGSMGLWDVSNATSMSYMFYYADSFNQDIGNWNVSNVTDMGHMFELADDFNQDVGNWDVSNVTNMSYMFDASDFNNGGSPSINNWNVSGVTDMSSMFSYSFNQPIGNWDVSNVTDMSNMFGYSFNQPIGNWDVSNVTNMNDMFNNTNFNQPLSGWNVSNVTDMSGMFRDTPFDQYINNWNVSNVTNMNHMFGGSNFNQPLSGWNVSNVTDMGAMFWDFFGSTTLFNQDIGNWNVSGVTDFVLFMGNRTDSDYLDVYLDSIYNGWSSLPSVQSGININFGSIKYTAAGTAGRAILSGTYGWSIVDGGI